MNSLQTLIAALAYQPGLPRSFSEASYPPATSDFGDAFEVEILKAFESTKPFGASDDAVDETLDQRSDHAEETLDFFTDRAGTTGSDRGDILELIVDLLHLADDLELVDGEPDENANAVLSRARRAYWADRRALQE